MTFEDYKIGVFTYDFPHKKTYEGVMFLILNDIIPDVIFGAPKVDLNIETCKIRAYTKGMNYMHPRDIATKLNLPYVSLPHNNPDIKTIIETLDLDIGIILGARIINKEIIDSFNIGIINSHPGLLPDMAGLDPVQWAILEDTSMGVSIHFINDKIDQGILLEKQQVPVFKDDTFVDILLRIQNEELHLLVKTIKDLKYYLKEKARPLETANYHKGVPKEREEELLIKFKKYKEKWAEN